MNTFDVKSVKRFDTELRVSEIPGTMADASASLANLGEMIQSADRLLTLAVARTLIDATAKDADPLAIVGQIGAALDNAQLGSGPAKRASKAMGAALSVAKSATAPMNGSTALKEAREIVAYIFDHETKLRAERRKKSADKKLADIAAKAEETAKKARDKADAEEANGIEADKPCNALVGPEGDAVDAFDADGFEIMVEFAALLRNVGRGERQALLIAARQQARQLRGEAQQENNLAAVG